MRLEPALPSTSSTSPSRSTIDGAIMLGIRRPAGCRWKPSGLRSSSPIMLLRWMPGAGHDDARALAVRAGDAARAARRASSTEMWVVEPSREARKRSRKPVLAEALDELRRALGLRRRHRRDDAAAASAAPGRGRAAPSA